jgi:putative membrane protein
VELEKETFMMKLMTLQLMVLTFASAQLQAIAQQAQVPTAPPSYYGPGPWHMWEYGGSWHFWLMLPMMIVFFLLLCAVVFMFARSAFDHWGPYYGGHGHLPDRFSGDATRSALQILNERFARGEIQKEEYVDKKAALLSGR